MRLYIEGHNAKKGFLISITWSDAECASLPFPSESKLKPVRFISSLERAKRFVNRWNRMFATH
ncbi:TPA: hypothetical protein ACIJ25_001884 [Pseudomonas aeruginosa]